MKKSQILAALILGLAGAIASVPAFADTVTFTFSGATSSVGNGRTDTGSGSFTYSGPLSTVTLADLTAFSFEDDADLIGVGTATFNYVGTSDLTSFSASIASGAVTALSLTTVSEAPTTSTVFFSDGSFIVNSLGNAEMSFDSGSHQSTGSVSTTGPGLPPSVPEGGAGLMYLLLAAACLACAFGARATGRKLLA
jgi:hypothetical protein